MYSYYNSSRGYLDLGDGQELGSKRQRVVEQGSSYYAPTPGSSFTYNPTPYSPQISQNPFPVVRLRGLPFGCTETDVSDFLHCLSIVDVLLTHKGGRFSGEAYCVLGYQHQVEYALQRNRQNIGRRYVELRVISWNSSKTVLLEDKVHIAYNSDGRPSGDAFVEFAGPEESKAAMSMDRKTLGSRYVELFPSSKQEMDEAIAKGRKVDVEGREPSVVHTGFLRMRGLPFSASKEDIVDFFKEFVIPEDNIHIMYNPDGRRTGETFVMFSKPEDAKAALTKDRKTLGSRYIELFVSSLQELDEALSGSGARR
ncbi:Heterogeneous nuclear ribonucleoprotein H2-like protein [Drosera capensis]